MKKIIVILAVILVLLSAIVLYYVNRYRPVPLLDSNKDVSSIALTYEPWRDEIQEINNYDKTALLDCLYSYKMKWLQSGSYALGQGDRIVISIWEKDGSASSALYIYLGARSVVSVDNNWYEILEGDKAYEAVMELIKEEVQATSD